MLPSMPLLDFNSKDSCSSEVRGGNQNVQELEIPEKSTVELVEPVETALLAPPSPEIKESGDEQVSGSIPLSLPVSTAPEKRKLKSSAGYKKRKKCIQPEDLIIYGPEDSESYYAETYFIKVMKSVTPSEFEKFISILQEYDCKQINRLQMFRKMEELFSDYPELVEGFLGFLSPEEALECKKLTEKNINSDAWKLLKYIEPSQMNKLITILEQNLDNEKMSVTSILQLVQSLFKSQPSVYKKISSLFLNGPAPLKNVECYEKVFTLNADLQDLEFETVRVPLQTMKSCQVLNCLCLCHSSPPEALCSACNITVHNCRFYVKKDKMMRVADIEFDGYTSSEMQKKLYPEYFARREALEMMASSPSKAKSEKRERKNTAESINVKKSENNATESKAIPDVPKTEPVVREMMEVQTVICEEDKFGNLEFFETINIIEKGNEKALNRVIGEESKLRSNSPKKRRKIAAKQPSENVKVSLFPEHRCTNDFNEVKDVSLLEDQVKIEEIKSEIVDFSESDVVVKSETLCSLGLEGNEEPLESNTAVAGSSDSVCEVKLESPVKRSWTREEDKVILEAFRNDIGTEHTFTKISSLMPNRTVPDIQSRFRDLMILLEKITSENKDG